MKPLSPPTVPGDTPRERFGNALRKVLTISKTELLKAEEKWKQEHAKKKRRK